MATKQCYTCKYNGKKSKACLTCNTNVAPRRSRDTVSIDAHPALADKLIQEQGQTESPLFDESTVTMADFFREWLFLPTRQRDILAALYVNNFVMSSVARELKIGPKQIRQVCKQLEKHPYFSKFMPSAS